MPKLVRLAGFPAMRMFLVSWRTPASDRNSSWHLRHPLLGLAAIGRAYTDFRDFPNCMLCTRKQFEASTHQQ